GKDAEILAADEDAFVRRIEDNGVRAANDAFPTREFAPRFRFPDRKNTVCSEQRDAAPVMRKSGWHLCVSNRVVRRTERKPVGFISPHFTQFVHDVGSDQPVAIRRNAEPRADRQLTTVDPRSGLSLHRPDDVVWYG